MGVLFSGATHIGRKRKTNQDSIYLNGELHFFMVADGMGGHFGGDTASQMCIKYAPLYLKDHWERVRLQGDTGVLGEAANFASQKIFEWAEQHPHLKGMGTTMVAGLFFKSSLYLASVGDSRAYLYAKDHLFQLTVDHTLVQEKLNLGLYQIPDAILDPQKNVLVRSVGYEREVACDLFSYQVCKRDLFILSSDGLHSKVSDRDIHFLIEREIKNKNINQQVLDQLVQTLIFEANESGGQDNISVIACYAE